MQEINRYLGWSWDTRNTTVGRKGTVLYVWSVVHARMHLDQPAWCPLPWTSRAGNGELMRCSDRLARVFPRLSSIILVNLAPQQLGGPAQFLQERDTITQAYSDIRSLA